MYVATVPNRNSPPAILLRESFRLGGKVHNRTLANLSHWPPDRVDAMRAVLKGATSVGAPLPQAFDIVRSRPHGHVAAVLGTVHRLHLDTLIDQPSDLPSSRALLPSAPLFLKPSTSSAPVRTATLPLSSAPCTDCTSTPSSTNIPVVNSDRKSTRLNSS